MWVGQAGAGNSSSGKAPYVELAAKVLAQERQEPGPGIILAPWKKQQHAQQQQQQLQWSLSQ
jgi:hypothetical protein